MPPVRQLSPSFPVCLYVARILTPENSLPLLVCSVRLARPLQHRGPDLAVKVECKNCGPDTILIEEFGAGDLGEQSALMARASNWK